MSNWPSLKKKHLWALVSWFWVTFCTSRILQDSAAARIQGYEIDYDLTVINYSSWLFWIPLTFLILKISRRYPIDRYRAWKAFAIHLGFALIAAALHYGFQAVFMYITVNVFFPDRSSEGYFPFVFYSLHLPIMFYFLIVAADQGVNYVMKFQDANIKNIKLKAQLFSAQNEALKMQIQPHFLFNTHHSIVSLIVQNKNQEAIEMLTGLSDLLRKTIDITRSNYVTVQEEVETIRLYLSIQQTRYARLKSSYSITPEVENALVPPFILQPLIENAIIHGIQPVVDSGRINIHIKSKNNRLEI